MKPWHVRLVFVRAARQHLQYDRGGKCARKIRSYCTATLRRSAADGEWHQVIERDRTGSEPETWPLAYAAVVEWLALRTEDKIESATNTLKPRTSVTLEGRTVTHMVRQFTVNSEPWTVYEDRARPGGPTLVFQTDWLARRVRVYPAPAQAATRKFASVQSGPCAAAARLSN